ncbi:MAG: DUF427 domain-containing protein [Bacteroidota bacterium]
MSRPKPLPTQPGQESVWDYPRPPHLEAFNKTIRIEFAGREIARTSRAYRVLETSHPPVYYLPPEDINMTLLSKANSPNSHCEWKGAAHYYHLVVEGRESQNIAWAYAYPTPPFAAIKDHLAFYADRVDACFIDDERVKPQPGGFYGGWITDNIIGPFKGEPGSWGW